MCRIMYLYSNGLSNETINDLIKLFIESSRYDKYKARISRRPGHPDGWGYVVVGVYRDNHQYIHYYKSLKAIYEDDKGVGDLLGTLRDLRRYVLMIHSRAASSRNTINMYSTHPIHLYGDTYEYWIIHNGSMDYEKLALELKITPNNNITDTYYLAKYIVSHTRKLDINNLEKAFKNAVKYTESAMNTFNLFLGLNGEVFVVNTMYVTKNILNNNVKLDYYKLYRCGIGNGLGETVLSSTIFDKAKKICIEDYEELVNRGIIYVFDRGLIRISYDVFAL
jgi:predicted glutamine amidotransferase